MLVDVALSVLRIDKYQQIISVLVLDTEKLILVHPYKKSYVSVLSTALCPPGYGIFITILQSAHADVAVAGQPRY